MTVATILARANVVLTLLPVALLAGWGLVEAGRAIGIRARAGVIAIGLIVILIIFAIAIVT